MTTEVLQLAGGDVKISNPDKLIFPEAGITKRELIDYYLMVSSGALRGIYNRPIVLKRFVHGIHGEFFFQKRIPKSSPEWLKTVRITFPSGRKADELVVTNEAQLIWMIQQGCLDLNPHATRTDDLEHPDELRVDLDPCPDVPWEQVIQVALVVREVLSEHGLLGWPKTSGSRGIHINVRIERRWPFEEVRRACLALAREVAKRVPKLATAKWWKEERHGVFLDYNQNARDRTVASAYSVRPVVNACVSAPLSWEEVPTCRLQDFTVKSMRVRYESLGDIGAGIDDAVCDLSSLLELADSYEEAGQGDAPWPPHYPKQEGEPPRVQPSRKKAEAEAIAEVTTEAEAEATTEAATEAEVTTEAEAEESPKVVATTFSLPIAPILTIAEEQESELADAKFAAWCEKNAEAAACLRDPDIIRDRVGDRHRVRVHLRNLSLDQRRSLLS